MNIKTHQEECHNENGEHGETHAFQCIRPHGQILFIEDVEYRIWEHLDLGYLGLAHPAQPKVGSHRFCDVV